MAMNGSQYEPAWDPEILAAAAKDMGMTVSAFIKRAVRQYLQRNGY